MPFKSINCETDLKKHEYPIDLISTSPSLFATSDVSNQIKLWSYDSESQDLIKTFKLNENTSIWSMCITEDSQFILIGFSDGSVKMINLSINNITREHGHNESNGVTYLKELKSKNKNSDSFIHKSSPNLSQENRYTILIARLSGLLEVIEFNNQTSSSLFTLRAHRSPITSLFYASGGDYLMTSGQDFLLKIIKINFSNQNPSEQIVHEKKLKIMFESEDHGESLITAICIDKENTINGASGSQDGTIFIWNLFTGERLRVLNDIMNSMLKSPGIVKLEMSQNLLMSINSDHQMCIFNRNKGRMIREFKFFAPILPGESQRGDSGDLNSTTDNCLNSISGSILNLIASGVFEIFRNLLFYNRNKIKNLNELKNDDLVFRPVPSMCLYSKTILITGGCSCIFLWNIEKGELIKKINIKKSLFSRNSVENFSQMNSIKEIKLIRQVDSSPRTLMNTKFNRVNKLVLVTDYNDAIYVLKIPTNIAQNFD